MTAWQIIRLSCLTLLWSACAPLQGPPLDLETVAAPDPVPPLPIMHPSAPQTPQASSWRAWVPRRITPAGDEVEGHWILLQQTPPAFELLAPAKGIPRVPRHPALAKRPAPSKPSLPAPAVHSLGPSTLTNPAWLPTTLPQPLGGQ